MKRMAGLALTIAPWLILSGSATVAAAQTLDLPSRRPDAPTGTAFVEEIRDLDLEHRERRILEEVLSGNLPSWLRRLTPIPLEGPGGEAITAWVAVDYLAVGSDTDYLYVPMTPGTAQRIADALGASLPTPRLVDRVWTVADMRLPPSPIPPSEAMTAVPVFAAHSAMVAEQGEARTGYPGTLTAGHKKDVVISRQVESSPGRVAIYGWHRPDGTPIQPLYLGHTDRWVDYSHGVRLVRREIRVDGAPMDLWAALRRPELAAAFSSEGPIPRPRYR